MLSLQSSCQTDSIKLEEESLAIINLLYNKESNNFPVPQPPNGDLSPVKPRKRIASDKHINKKKHILVIRENGNIEYKKEIDLSIEFRNILTNPESIFESKKLLKVDIKDINGDKIPIIVSNGSLKIQNITKKYKVLGVLFLSNIKFNESLNKAVIQFGAYTHELAGHTSLICLEKKQGSWQVVTSKNLSES